MLKVNLLKSLIFNYSDLGSLDLESQSCPEEILQAIRAAIPNSSGLQPLLQKKKKSSSIDSQVLTPYGGGKVIDVSECIFQFVFSHHFVVRLFPQSRN